MQSSIKKEFCLLIAQIIYPGIFLSKPFEWKQYYAWFRYHNLIQVDIIQNAKLQSDKWDFAFTLICKFGKAEKQHGNEWFFDRGSSFELGMPRVTVVQRKTVTLEAKEVLKGMHSVFKANVLLLHEYNGESKETWVKQLQTAGVNVVFEDQLISQCGSTEPILKFS